MRGRMIAVLCLALAACGREPDETDANVPIRAKAGERVEVYVRSNPSTGYDWSIAEAPDTTIVAPAGKRYRQRSGTEDQDGAGGTERWTFTARRPGRTQVLLGYARPWDKGVAPAETRRFTFVVE